MNKTAYIDGYCPFLNSEVSIKAEFARYAPLGSEAYATLAFNYCEHFPDCPQADQCPVLDRPVLWSEL